MSRQTSLKKAKFLLESIIDKLQDENAWCEANAKAYMKSLDLYAQLLSATQEISPQQIIDDYLEKSVAVAQKGFSTIDSSQ